MIGVCKTAEDVSRITTKSSREVSKRTLYLIDSTGKMVAATLWGEEVIIKGSLFQTTDGFASENVNLCFSSTAFKFCFLTFEQLSLQ